MLENVVDHFGGKAALAEALGVTRPAVSQWIAAGALPPFRAVQVERITKGAFRAVDLIGDAGEGCEDE
ncbi:MAG: Cro/CI family transcriptional regulator [Acidiferrobacterales bacterium]|nr:Cro/CI family transcriptional regulator [Acidiferrobacterales bacterium]